MRFLYRNQDRREKTHVTNTTNGGVITSDPMNTKRIIKGDNEKLYAYKLYNLDKRDQLFERQNLPNSHNDSYVI